MKKLFIAAGLLASTLSMSTQAKTWHYAEVLLVGSGYDGKPMVRLTSLNNETYKFTNKLFNFKDILSTKGMAICMAAATSNRKVFIESNVDEIDSSTRPTIYGIFLSKDVVPGK